MGALDGLTVIDFSHYPAGPLATLWLAECGAEVIRVDPPGGPKYRHSANAILQRSKQSILLVHTWQTTIMAMAAIVIGVPVGIIIGRELWIMFARNISAVPDPSVPILSVVLVGVGSLVVANLVAALPGRSAARTPAALVLRAE